VSVCARTGVCMCGGGAGGDEGVMLECVCILECMHFHARICICMNVCMYVCLKV